MREKSRWRMKFRAAKLTFRQCEENPLWYRDDIYDMRNYSYDEDRGLYCERH